MTYWQKLTYKSEFCTINCTSKFVYLHRSPTKTITNMKEYLLTFSNQVYNKRKLWTNSEYQKFIPYIGKADKNGVVLLNIEIIN